MGIIDTLLGNNKPASPAPASTVREHGDAEAQAVHAKEVEAERNRPPVRDTRNVTENPGVERRTYASMVDAELVRAQREYRARLEAAAKYEADQEAINRRLGMQKSEVVRTLEGLARNAGETVTYEQHDPSNPEL